MRLERKDWRKIGDGGFSVELVHKIVFRSTMAELVATCASLTAPARRPSRGKRRKGRFCVQLRVEMCCGGTLFEAVERVVKGTVP